jgi:serine/threonine protein phosphatase 1
MLGFGKAKAGQRASVGEGRRVWAVGDVHGCIDLLQALVTQILVMQSMLQPARIIFLGDYVDRGPSSRAVLDFLSDFQMRQAISASFIRGNHDHMMMEFLSKPEAGPSWKAIGGASTLSSYGVTPPPDHASPAVWKLVWAQFKAAVPLAHRIFLESLSSSLEEGDYFFTHAGIVPGKSLDRQNPKDLMWIRNRFLQDQRVASKIVVHGHTPAAMPHSDHRRIGVDTGAYASGELTAVCLDGPERRFLQVRRLAPDRIVPVWDVRSSTNG